MHQDGLLDKIYEAAVAPDLWQSVIEATARQTGCFGGSLFTAGTHGTMISASENCEEHLRALIEDGWAEKNIRAQRLVSRAHIGFVTDHDLCDEDEIANHTIYADFLRPRGLGWSVATHISGVNDDIAIFCIDQSYAAGPITAEVCAFLDCLRPHIARATLLASQFQLERVSTSLRDLELVGIPAAAVDRTGRVRMTNHRFLSANQYAKIGAFDRIEIQDEQTKPLFRDALAAGESGSMARSVPALGQGEGAAPCILHLIPVKRQARDIFSQVDAIVAILPLNSPSMPFSQFLRRLYDITHAEARIAKALVSGRSAQDIAQLYDIGIETVRTHIKRLLSKTGVKRQSDFIVRFSTFQFLD